MAEKADACPCTHPELPQFQWVSEYDQVAVKGKTALKIVFLFRYSVSSPSLCLHTVLKGLHYGKGILREKECGQCASKELYWYALTAIVVATKPPESVKQTLDVVRKQSDIEDSFSLGEVARLLKGKADITAINA